MNNVQIVNMNATELFRQQVAGAMEGIRFQNSGGTQTYIPLQLGGPFAQLDLLSGGHALRITRIVEDSNG
jgi:hypothetical protein